MSEPLALTRSSRTVGGFCPPLPVTCMTEKGQGILFWPGPGLCRKYSLNWRGERDREIDLFPQMLGFIPSLKLCAAPLHLCGGKRQSLLSRTGGLSVHVRPVARMHEAQGPLGSRLRECVTGRESSSLVLGGRQLETHYVWCPLRAERQGGGQVDGMILVGGALQYGGACSQHPCWDHLSYPWAMNSLAGTSEL